MSMHTISAKQNRSRAIFRVARQSWVLSNFCTFASLAHTPIAAIISPRLGVVVTDLQIRHTTEQVNS
jgi:hypothetical protein